MKMMRGEEEEEILMLVFIICKTTDCPREDKG
jgi:hypothetical protein